MKKLFLSTLILLLATGGLLVAPQYTGAAKESVAWKAMSSEAAKIASFPWSRDLLVLFVHAETSSKTQQLHEAFKKLLDDALDNRDESDFREDKRTSQSLQHKKAACSWRPR
ncbi:MAG: hypothetical protein LBD10_03375 [Desulfobulbus sp.]|jgi:hypothetical protein|uniref:hypothetical protein n=1 Tax=Desulfobulbus sp. TaxID=895 RepID=UPI0028457B70|nr:hypothetical protein [Desulfobulbus sp.]MDR2549229.1 hypothetical protein [Desulfobulbus sp.]